MRRKISWLALEKWVFLRPSRSRWSFVILLFQPILSPLQQKRILIHLNQLQNIKLERNRRSVSISGQKRRKLNFPVLVVQWIYNICRFDFDQFSDGNEKKINMNIFLSIFSAQIASLHNFFEQRQCKFVWSNKNGFLASVISYLRYKKVIIEKCFSLNAFHFHVIFVIKLHRWQNFSRKFLFGSIYVNAFQQLFSLERMRILCFHLINSYATGNADTSSSALTTKPSSTLSRPPNLQLQIPALTASISDHPRSSI